MNEEEFDRTIRQALPPASVSDARVDRLIDAVLDRAEPRPLRSQRAVRRWPILLPVLRFGIPMTIALVLGVTVGQAYEEDWPVAQFSTLYLSTTLVPVGS